MPKPHRSARLLLILLLVATVGSAQPPVDPPIPCFDQTGCVPRPEGLVAWYPLDSSPGGVEPDVAPGSPASPGNDEGGVAHGPGAVGDGLVLNGSVAFVEAFGAIVPAYPGPGKPSHELDVKGDAFSASAWIRTTGSGQAIEPILEKRSDQPIGWTLFLYNGRLGFQLAAQAPEAKQSKYSNWIAPATSAKGLRDGKWHHVVVSLDRSSTTGGRLFVDGALVFTFDPTPRVGDTVSVAPLLFGLHMNGQLVWKGSIDEVMIFQKALGEGDVSKLFKAKTAPLCVC